MNRLSQFAAALPRLAPEYLVTVAADARTTTLWRLRQRWNGQRSLEPAAPPPGTPCIVILDHGLPLRRRLQRLPQREKERRLLLLSAPDEFPVTTDSHVYGLGASTGEGYVYAVPRSLLERIRDDGCEPALVLVADAVDRSDTCLAAIDQYAAHGPSFAIGGGRFIDRGRLRRIALGTTLGLILAASVALLAMPGIFGNLAEEQLARLEAETGELERILKSTESMAATMAAARRQQQQPEARLPELLNQLFAGVPPGHAIRRFEVRDGKLLVAGEGAEVEAWLTDAGFARENIVVEASANFRRFRAERPL